MDMQNASPDYLAKKIRELRQAEGFSQERVGEILGVAKNTVSRWETGTYRPSVDDLQAIATLFKVHPGVFFPPFIAMPVSDEDVQAWYMKCFYALQQIQSVRCFNDDLSLSYPHTDALLKAKEGLRAAIAILEEELHKRKLA